MSVETHFSNIQSVIIRELNKANRQISVAVAWFTDDSLYNKLEDALRRGIKVNLILNDDDINQFSGLNFENLVNIGAEIYLYDSNEDTMHQKFCVIDNDIVLSGSYNWTKRAANRNTENLIVFNNERDTILNFKKQFEELKLKSKKFIKKEKFNIRNDLIIDEFFPSTPIISVKPEIDLSAESITYEYKNPDLIPFRVDVKWGYCDKKRNVKIPLLFDESRPYCEGIAAIKVNDKWGFIDSEGKKICDCIYSRVTNFKNGYASVQFSKYFTDMDVYNWGIINRSGAIIIETKYHFIGEYSSGLFNFSNNPMAKGYLDKKNEVAINPIYSGAEPFSEGIACIKNRNSQYDKNLSQYDKSKPENICFFINNNKEVLFDRGFKSLSSFNNGYAPVEIHNSNDYHGNFGLIDIHGQYVIKPDYIDIGKKFNQGRIAVSKKIFTGRYEGEYEQKYGFVDINNNVLIPFKFDDAGDFNNNRAPVRHDLNGKFGKYGYINMEGKLIIDFIFEYGYSFKDNLAQVKIGGQKGYIDVNGNQYWED